MSTTIDQVFSAIYHGQFDQVKELIARDKSVLKKKRESTQETLLHFAIRNMKGSSDVKIFNHILDEIKQFPEILNAIDGGQSNALHLAADRGYIDIVKPLLEAGIDYKATACYGVFTVEDLFKRFEDGKDGKLVKQYNDLIAQFEREHLGQAKVESQVITLASASTSVLTTPAHHSEPSTPTHHTQQTEEKDSADEKAPLLSKSAPSLNESLLSQQIDTNENTPTGGQASLRKRKPTTILFSSSHPTTEPKEQGSQKKAVLPPDTHISCAIQ